MKQLKTIPKGWEETTLGKVVDICTGKRDANHGSKNGQYQFFTCSQKVYKIDNYSFDTEAVLVAGNGDFNVKYYQGKFDAYQRTYVLDNFKNSFGKFIFYKVEQVLEKITKNNQGSSVKFIKKGDLENYKFLLPPFSEQKKIAEILGSVDEDIEKTGEIIKETEKLKKGLMQNLFTKGIGHKKFKKTKLGEIPEKWEVVKIKDSGIEIIDGDRGVNYPKLEDFSNNGFCLFLNNKNIKNDKFVFNECNFINKEKDDSLRKGKLKRDDIVLTTRGTVGNVAYYDFNIEYENIRINSGMIIFRHGEKYNPLFLYKLLSSYLLKKEYLNMGSGSAQPQLPIRNLINIKIPMLPIEEQKEIANIIVDIDKKLEINKSIKNKLNQLKRGLMQDLLSGRVLTNI